MGGGPAQAVGYGGHVHASSVGQERVGGKGRPNRNFREFVWGGVGQHAWRT
jgi:hypothetical protein